MSTEKYPKFLIKKKNKEEERSDPAKIASLYLMIHMIKKVMNHRNKESMMIVEKLNLGSEAYEEMR